MGCVGKARHIHTDLGHHDDLGGHITDAGYRVKRRALSWIDAKAFPTSASTSRGPAQEPQSASDVPSAAPDGADGYAHAVPR
jgi:hypothetical protein